MVTCFTSYPRKIYEKVIKCIFIFLISYFTQLSMNRLNKTRIGERKPKKGAKDISPEQHLSPWREWSSRDHVFWNQGSPQRSYTVIAGMEFQRLCYFDTRAHHDEKFLPGELRRFGASGWWLGRNPLAKKGHLARARKSCLTRKLNSAEV